MESHKGRRHRRRRREAANAFALAPAGTRGSLRETMANPGWSGSLTLCPSGVEDGEAGRSRDPLSRTHTLLAGWVVVVAVYCCHVTGLYEHYSIRSEYDTKSKGCVVENFVLG